MTLSINSATGTLQIKRSDGTQLIGSNALLAKNLSYKLTNTVTLNSTTSSYQQDIGYESGQYNVLANITVTEGSTTILNNVVLALNSPIILKTVTVGSGYVHDVLTTTLSSANLTFVLQRITFSSLELSTATTGGSYNVSYINMDGTYDFNHLSPLTVTLSNIQIYTVLDQT
jgi:hypothetical protein